MHVTTVKKLAEKHPGLSEKAIRVHIARRNYNGLEKSGAIFSRGKRRFLFEELYLSWLSGRPAEDFMSLHLQEVGKSNEH